MLTINIHSGNTLLIAEARSANISATEVIVMPRQITEKIPLITTITLSLITGPSIIIFLFIDVEIVVFIISPKMYTASATNAIIVPRGTLSFFFSFGWIEGAAGSADADFIT